MTAPDSVETITLPRRCEPEGQSNLVVLSQDDFNSTRLLRPSGSQRRGFWGHFKGAAALPRLILGLVLFSPQLPAAEFHFFGNFKSVGGYNQLRQTNLYPRNTQLFAEERLRLAQTLDLGPFFIEVANEASFFWNQPNNPVVPLPPMPPPPSWNTLHQWTVSDSTYVVYHLDRLYAQFSRNDFQVIVGKQVVAIGVGQLFAAVSQVPRYPFIIVDPEFPITEDAATLIWRGPLTLEARYLPHTATQKKDNFHLRAKGSKNGYDVALTAGQSDDKSFVALESAGNLGDQVLRGEMVAYTQNSASWIQAMIGYDCVFNAKWSGTVEVFYNGFGNPAAGQLPFISHRPSPYRNQWYGGLNLSWEASPRLKLRFISVVNATDLSLLNQGYFTYSLGNSTELLAGRFFSLANQPSGEFGGTVGLNGMPFTVGLPDLTYLLVKTYF